MKNLLLAIVVLIALAAAGRSDIEDLIYDHFPEKTFPDGFPLSANNDAICGRNAPLFMIRNRGLKEDFLTLKEDLSNVSSRGVDEIAYAPYMDMGRTGRIGGDFTVTFAFKMLQDPQPGMVLFHAGNEYDSMIELRFGGRPCRGKRCGEPDGTAFPIDRLDAIEAVQKSADLVQKSARGRITPASDTLRFRLTPDYYHGGQSRATFISASEEDRIYAGEWVHVVAVHEHGCNKLGSGMTLYINGRKSFEDSLVGRDNFDYAYVPPMNGREVLRDYQYLGMGGMGGPRHVPLNADFTCLQILNKAVNLGEVETLFRSANAYLRRGELFTKY